VAANGIAWHPKCIQGEGLKKRIVLTTMRVPYFHGILAIARGWKFPSRLADDDQGRAKDLNVDMAYLGTIRALRLTLAIETNSRHNRV
jgi:hypothetical protein